MQSERYWLVAVNQKHCVKVCVRVKPVKRKGLGIPAAATCFVKTETPASSANPSFSPAGTISSSTRWTGNTQRNLDHFTALTRVWNPPGDLRPTTEVSCVTGTNAELMNDKCKCADTLRGRRPRWWPWGGLWALNWNKETFQTCLKMKNYWFGCCCCLKHKETQYKWKDRQVLLELQPSRIF